MSTKQTLIFMAGLLLLALAACASRVPGPAEPTVPTPTKTPVPPTTEPPTEPATGEAEEDERASLTDQDLAYLQWLAGVHGKFEETAKGLVERWQESEVQGPEGISAEAIEEMEALAGSLQDYVEEVEEREDVPAGLAEVHAALLNEVHHWDAAAPLLVEGMRDLSEGDREAFQEKGEEADEEIQAAVQARRELLEAANELLEALREGDEG